MGIHMAKNKPAAEAGVEALKSLLGDEAATLLARGPNAESFRRATKELKEEKQEALVEQAKDKIGAALEAERKIDALEREFKGKLASARKALKKLVGPLTALMNGNEPNSYGPGEEGGFGVQEDKFNDDNDGGGGVDNNDEDGGGGDNGGTGDNN